MVLGWFFAKDFDDLDTHASISATGSGIVYTIVLGLAGFIAWASHYEIEQVARAYGEVIASSRVQVIQAVDGGVLEALKVREGDTVRTGEVLARLDQSRFGAAVEEIEARLAALKAKAKRLRAEVIESPSVNFGTELSNYPEFVVLEEALFRQRRQGFRAGIAISDESIRLAEAELALVLSLTANDDANQAELLNAQRTVNDMRARRIEMTNRFFESARAELAQTEDHIAQNAQILKQRENQLEESVLVARSSGIVKNIRVTTVGGVLRAGEELMQIVPLDDTLIVEAKASPADIAQVKPGLSATIRLDPFDYTIFGAVAGEVSYVSADTLKEDSGRGEEIYYRVHVVPTAYPAVTTIGRTVEMVPGMTGQVDIRTGKRTVLDYLLKPIRKTLSESLGEG